MYYGNAGASNQQASPISGVWSDNYIGVWHLQQSGNGTSGEFVDSLGTNNLQGGNGTANQVPTQTAGQVSFGQSFDGSNDWITKITSVSGLSNLNTSKTLSLWYKVTSNPGSEKVLISLQDGTLDSNGDQLEFQNGTTFRISTANPSTIISTPDPAANVWHKVDWTYNGTTNRLYIDGSQVNTSGTSPQTQAIAVIVFGNYYLSGAGATPYGGLLDEVRIASSVLSATWIQTEYNNQSSPSTFESFLTTPVSQVFGGVHISGGTSIKSN